MKKRITGAEVKKIRKTMKMSPEEFGAEFERSKRFVQEKESGVVPIDRMFQLALERLKQIKAK